MRVEIINVSHHKQLSFIGECAGISHGKTDPSVDRALGCWMAGHTSVLEHVPITFVEHMERCGDAYQSALDAGIKPEDARYLLPEATKTNLVMTMNLREFESFYKLRSDKAAQWEIRELAGLMIRSMDGIGGEWQAIAGEIHIHAIKG